MPAKENSTSIERMHQRRSFFFLLWGVFAVASFAWSFTSPLNSLSDPPGQDRDDVFYDNIAFNLSQGEGFRLDFSNNEWKKIYLQPQEGSQPNHWLRTIDVSGPTAARAPAFPVMLSYCYRFFGRQWIAPRLLNVALISLGAALLIFYVGRQFESPLVPLIASLTLLGDFSIWGFATKVTTEPMAVLAVAGLFITVHESNRSTSKLPWLVVGLAFGAATLVRNNLNSWMLMLIVLAAMGLIFAPKLITDRKAFVSKFLLFLLGTAIVAGPWWYRNCQITDHFEPFGTAGKIGWVGGYCDQALENNGNWNLKAVVDQQRKSLEERSFVSMPLAEQEHFIGQDSFRSGFEWAQDNWRSVPKLMFLKAMSHLGFLNDFHIAVSLINIALFLSAAVGFWLSWKEFGCWSTLAIFLSVATAMITWAHFGRYSIPVRPLIHLGSAITGAYLINWLGHRWLPTWLQNA